MRTLLAIVAACLLGVSGGARAACTGEPSSVADLTETLDQVDDAFVSADTVAFGEAIRTLGPQLDCSEEVLPRSLVARIHRAQGLGAFANADDAALTQAFAAAKAIDPAFRFDSFLPASHPVARKYDEVGAEDERVPFEPPTSGFLLLDGVAADERPIQRAVVVQHIVGRNEVAFTGYMLPSDRIPPASVVQESVGRVARKGPKRTPLLVAGASAAALGAITYGFAAQRRSAYENAAPVDRPPLRTQTNRLVLVGVSLVGVGAGIGGVGLAVGQP